MPTSKRWWPPIAAGFAVIGCMSLAAIPLWALSSAGWGYDFHAYFEAAQRLLNTGSPYQPQTLGGRFSPGPGGLYLYSPVPALLVVPLTLLSSVGATAAWFVMRLTLLVATCALLPVSRSTRLAVLGVAALSFPVLYDLNLGNVSVIVTFLAVVGWRWLDRPLGSVAIAMSVAFRPTLALIGGWWLVRRQWKPFLWLSLAAVALVASSLPFVGVQGWTDYVRLLSNVKAISGVDSGSDLASAALSVGLSQQFGVLALMCGYALTVGAILLSLRRASDVSYVVAITGTLLVSPRLESHYLALLILPAALLADRGWRWAVLLPLLGWLPAPALPLAAITGLVLPLLTHDRGPGEDSILGGVTSGIGGRRAESHLPSA
jgi:hypothetical protein